MLNLGLKVLVDINPRALKNDSENGNPLKTFSIELHSLYKYLMYSSGFVLNESKNIKDIIKKIKTFDFCLPLRKKLRTIPETKII